MFDYWINRSDRFISEKNLTPLCYFTGQLLYRLSLLQLESLGRFPRSDFIHAINMQNTHFGKPVRQMVWFFALLLFLKLANFLTSLRSVHFTNNSNLKSTSKINLIFKSFTTIHTSISSYSIKFT